MEENYVDPDDAGDEEFIRRMERRKGRDREYNAKMDREIFKWCD